MKGIGSCKTSDIKRRPSDVVSFAGTCRLCDHCGIAYLTERTASKYCNQLCYYLSKPLKARPTGKCEECGVEFESKFAYLTKFCSAACKLAVRSRKMKGRPSTKPPRKVWNLVCCGCGVEFVRKYPPKSKKRKVYCTKKCCAESMKKLTKITSSVRPNKRWRIFRRDKFKCVVCGDVEKLQVDHLVAKSLGGGNSEENLITMCNLCNNGKSDDALTNNEIFKFKLEIFIRQYG